MVVWLGFVQFVLYIEEFGGYVQCTRTIFYHEFLLYKERISMHSEIKLFYYHKC